VDAVRKIAKHLRIAIAGKSAEIHPQIEPLNKSRKCHRFSWLTASKFEDTFTTEAGPERQRY
jgi:hypothetical protein